MSGGIIAALALGVTACAGWILILTHAWLRPQNRIWPPKTPGKGTVIWSWGLTIAIYVSIFQLGAREGNTLGLPTAVLALGWLIAILGSVFHSWASVSLGLAATSGWPLDPKTPGARCTKGPYKFSAHPQYIGQALSFFGLALASGGTIVWSVSALGALALFFAAVVEHMHLRTQVSHQ